MSIAALPINMTVDDLVLKKIVFAVFSYFIREGGDIGLLITLLIMLKMLYNDLFKKLY